jgi:methionine-rich copper-binding protein CopC
MPQRRRDVPDPLPATLTTRFSPSAGTSMAQDPGSVPGNSFYQRPSPLDAPPGLYTVNWKVISDDGDPVSGSWTFTVKPS